MELDVTFQLNEYDNEAYTKFGNLSLSCAGSHVTC